MLKIRSTDHDLPRVRWGYILSWNIACICYMYVILYVIYQHVSSSNFYVATYFGIHHKYVFLLFELFQCVSSGNIQSETLFGIDSHILVWLWTWTMRLPLVFNPVPQTSQLNGLSSAFVYWVLTCTLWPPLYLYWAPQTSHSFLLEYKWESLQVSI